MKHHVIFLIAILATVTGAASAQEADLTSEQQDQVRQLADEVEQQCASPAAPIVPDGTTATRDEMVVAQQALKAFMDTGNDYLACLEALENELGEDITQTMAAVITALYNRVVNTLQARADAFNDALADFREQDAE